MVGIVYFKYLLMNNIKNKIDWILPLIVSFLYFFTIKGLLSISCYDVIALLSAFYYFPFRLFTNMPKQLPYRLLYFISCVICTTFFVLSIINLHFLPSQSLQYFIAIASIINFIYLFYFYLQTEKK